MHIGGEQIEFYQHCDFGSGHNFQFGQHETNGIPSEMDKILFDIFVIPSSNAIDQSKMNY